MKRRSTILFTIPLLFGGLVASQGFAADRACPYMANDSKVLALAESTEGLLKGLQDAKEKCGQGFVDAVKSINSLPELLKKTDDPALKEKIERDVVVREIAKCLADPAYGSRPYQDHGTYLDYLTMRKIDLDLSISIAEAHAKPDDRESSKKQAIALTSNLLGALSQASQNGKCRDHLSNHYFGQMTEVGLGVLATTSPLLFAAAPAAAVGIAAGLLADLVNLINSIPPRALRDFEKTKQTLEMACVYHAIMTTSCEMKESSLTPESYTKARRNLRNMASCIGDSKLYNEYLNSEKLNTEYNQVLFAIGTMDPSLMLPSGIESGPGGDLSNRVDRLRGNSSGGEREILQRLSASYAFLKEVLIDKPATYDKAESNVQQKITALAHEYNSVANNYLKAIGQAVPTQPVGGGQEIPPLQLFKDHNAKFKVIIDKKLNEAVSGGAGGNLRALEGPAQIHGRVDLVRLLDKVGYTKKFFSRIKSMKPEQLGTSAADFNNLQRLIARSEAVLDEMVDWARINPRDFANDEDYKDSIKTKTKRISDMIRAQTTTNTDIGIQTTLNEILREPFTKIYSMMTARTAHNAGAVALSDKAGDDLFADPFKPAYEVTPFERFSVLKDMASKLSDGLYETKDRFLLNKTRKLFENSDLKKNFKDGLRRMIKDMESDPDPGVTRDMVIELCGLAISLPDRDGAWHAIEECENLMPRRMLKYFRAQKTPGNDCSYVRYFKEKTLEDSNKFGRPLSLPVSSSAGEW